MNVLRPDIDRGGCRQAFVDVTTANGILRGIETAGVRIFRGIPFAAARCGADRFRRPQPLSRWPGVRMATEFAPVPFQPADAGLYPGDPEAMQPFPMSEDCLFLNVWAPRDGGPHPVLVWVHGGGQVLGGTVRPVYDGTRFAKQGIVVVTVAYRLGAFGFLEAGDLLGADYEGSGANALRDILTALTWVHDNIAAFGGAPERITLGGESAGAKNIAALIAAPAAKGLFGAAVLMSGGAETVHSVAAARDVARKIVAAGGLAPDDLIRVEPARLLEMQDRYVAAVPDKFPFRPVFDTDVLPDHPLHAIAAGKGLAVPLLIGTNRDECAAQIKSVDAPWTTRLLAHVAPEEMARLEHAAAASTPAARLAVRRRLLAETEYRWPSIRLADAHSGWAPTWMFESAIELDAGPYAGFALHTCDLPAAWGRYPDRPGADALHELICRFVRDHACDAPPFDRSHRAYMAFGLDRRNGTYEAPPPAG